MAQKNTQTTPSYLEFADDPDKAWSVAKLSQVFEKVDLASEDVPKREGHVRIVCISDTHSLTNRSGPLTMVPDGDILVHAGDFSKVGKLKEIQAFNDYLASLSHPHKVIIAGNHDIGFDEKTSRRLHGKWFVPEAEVKAALKNCVYLEDSETEILGLRIYGSPWTPVFYDWAFLKARGEEINEVWKKIPRNIDILVTHGPPLGRGDVCFPAKNRAGCANLLNIVQNHVRPKFHIFGHIHEGYGCSSDGVTTFINASSCNQQYAPVNKPVVFDIAVENKTL